MCTSITGSSQTLATPSHSDLIVKPDSKLILKGQGADIDINGESLVATLRGIQQRLAILHVNPELEAEWTELKQLGDQYRELEQELLAKQQMWSTLKK